jgi:signal transduction histidine kinase
MLVMTIIVGIVALVFASLYFLLKKDLKALNKDILHRLDKESKATLTTQSSNREIVEFTGTINYLFLEKENTKLEYKKIDQELKENISNISHDFRTPLTAILGYCDLLLKSDLTEETKEYVYIINKKAKSLHHLIQDFYDFSRIMSTDYPINIDFVSICGLLKEVIFEYYEDFTDKDSSIDINIPKEEIKTISDIDALRRIFSNLISNMLRHGIGGYKIKLVKEGKDAYISFENKVIFMDQENLERIFERSYATDLSRGSSKSGLGLSIVKELSDRLNHDLEFSLKDNIFKIEIILKIMV